LENKLINEDRLNEMINVFNEERRRRRRRSPRIFPKEWQEFVELLESYK